MQDDHVSQEDLDDAIEAGICEHGTEDGDYCEECSAEYKRARGENGLDAEANS